MSKETPSSKDIIEALWHKLYTTGFCFEYYVLQDYCREKGFIFHPEDVVSDNYVEEEKRQLFIWLEEHLSTKSDEDVIGFFREYMNANTDDIIKTLL